jgi:hypothetical protein
MDLTTLIYWGVIVIIIVIVVEKIYEIFFGRGK